MGQEKTGSLGRVLLWTYGLSFGLFGIYLLLGGRLDSPVFPLFAVVYMWVPGLVALRFASQEGLRLPLALRPNRCWLFAWLFPVGLTLLSIPPSLPFGRWQGLKALQEAIPDLQTLPEGLLWGLLLFQGLLAGATVNLLAALGEELMWRGYLWERLRGRGFWPASLEIGLYWGFWHAPLILLGYNYPQHPFLGVGMMTLSTILLTPSLLYVREKGGSILAAALLHGTLNAVGGLSLLAVERTNDLLVGILGLPGLFLLAAFNLYLRSQKV